MGMTAAEGPSGVGICVILKLMLGKEMGRNFRKPHRRLSRIPFGWHMLPVQSLVAGPEVHKNDLYGEIIFIR